MPWTSFLIKNVLQPKLAHIYKRSKSHIIPYITLSFCKLVVMRTILFMLILVICTGANAQKEQTQKLNELFQGTHHFDLQKKGLKVNFLKNGEVFRTDFFILTEIDWNNLVYNAEENNVSIRCLGTYPNCVDRKIVKTKSRQPVPRISLKVGGEDQAQKAIELFKQFSMEK